MKKSCVVAIFATLTLAAVGVVSCQIEKLTTKEEALNLTAPSGMAIASNIADLKSDAAKIIAAKYGKQSFEITGIEYLPVKEGFAAIVSYRIANGATGNFAIFEGVKFNIQSQSIVTDTKTGKYLTSGETAKSNGGSIKIICNRTGDCECRVEGTLDTNTGIATWRCSCEQCSATITYS